MKPPITRVMRLGRRGRSLAAVKHGAALLAVGALIAGCAAADKTTSMSTSGTHASSSSSMAGMHMGSSSSSGSVPSVDGIKPVPTQVLGQGDWQGMKVTARAMTAVPFVIFNGASERMVKPPAHVSFHLMVMLNDAQTGVPIPYASVWATITKDGKLVYDERQWPMLSRYMGPHYGNDVALPGAGTYRITLLISPPVSARHVEYQHVWLKPHRMSFTFHWKPVT